MSVMARTIILTACLAMPAHADLTPPRMSLDGPADGCFAVVVIVNRLGVYIRDETLETDHGPVTLRYETIGGHNAIDADQVEVLALPDGVTADPMRMDLSDGETGRVCLREFLGF